MGAINWFTADHTWSRYWSNGAEQIEAALRRAPDQGPYPVRTLDDMSKSEIKKLEKLYGCSVADRHTLSSE